MHKNKIPSSNKYGTDTVFTEQKDSGVKLLMTLILLANNMYIIIEGTDTLSAYSKFQNFLPAHIHVFKLNCKLSRGASRTLTPEVSKRNSANIITHNTHTERCVCPT